jgi:uncharacterized protein YggE
MVRRKGGIQMKRIATAIAVATVVLAGVACDFGLAGPAGGPPSATPSPTTQPMSEPGESASATPTTPEATATSDAAEVLPPEAVMVDPADLHESSDASEAEPKIAGEGDETGLEETSKSTISVTGFGEVRTKADGAIVRLSVGPADPPMPVPGDDPITDENLRPLVDALVQMGIAREDIQTFAPQAYVSLEYATVAVRLSDPNLARPVITVAGDALAHSDTYRVTSANIQLTLSDCQLVESEARASAVADARARAEELAALLGKEIVDTVDVKDGLSDPQGWPIPLPSGCRALATGTYYPSADPGQQAADEAVISAFVRVTYVLR